MRTAKTQRVIYDIGLCSTRSEMKRLGFADHRDYYSAYNVSIGIMEGGRGITASESVADWYENRKFNIRKEKNYLGQMEYIITE